MESNNDYHYIFKYAFLVFGVLFVIASAMSVVLPESVEINAEKSSANFFSAAIMGLIGLIFVLIFFLFKDRFAIIEVKSQTLTIKKNGVERTVSWLDVTSISQIQFVQPPLYKLRIKGSDDVIWFNTEPRYFSIGGFTTDMSEMGRFIERKKNELGV